MKKTFSIKTSFAIMYALVKKEFFSLFYSKLAYVFLLSFLGLSIVFTFNYGRFFELNEANLNLFFASHAYLYLFFIPALSMKLWAEEEKDKTIELLLTFPISIEKSVVAKFLGVWLFLAVSLLMSFPLVITLYILGYPDFGLLLASYFASFLLGGSFLALGSLCSVLSNNLLTGFIYSFLLLLAVVLIGSHRVIDFFEGGIFEFFIPFLLQFDIITHYETLHRGVFDLRSFVFLVGIIIAGLVLTAIILRSRKSAHKYNQLFTILGCVMISLIFIFITIVNKNIHIRKDFTDNKIYSLSKYSKELSSKMQDELTIRFYYSKSVDKMPADLIRKAKFLQGLLDEYQGYFNNFSYEVIDPMQHSKYLTLAENDKVRPLKNYKQKNLYFSLTITYKNNILQLDDLAKSNMNTYEYILSKNLNQFVEARKKIAFFTPFKIAGKVNPYTNQTTEVWDLFSRLSKTYDVEHYSSMKNFEQKYNVNNQQLSLNQYDFIVVIYDSSLGVKQFENLEKYLASGGKVLFVLDTFLHVDFTNRKKLHDKLFYDYFLNKIGVKYNDKVVCSSKHYIPLQYESSILLDKTLLQDSDFSYLNRITYIRGGSFEYEQKGDFEYYSLLKIPDTYFVPRDKIAKNEYPKEEMKDATVLLEVTKNTKDFGKLFLLGDIDLLHPRMAKEKEFPNKIIYNDNSLLVQSLIENNLGKENLVKLRLRNLKIRTLENKQSFYKDAYAKVQEELFKLDAASKEYWQVYEQLNFKMSNQEQLTKEEEQTLSQINDFIKQYTEKRYNLMNKIKLIEKDFERKVFMYNLYSVLLLVLATFLFAKYFEKRKRKCI